MEILKPIKMNVQESNRKDILSLEINKIIEKLIERDPIMDFNS